MLNLCHAGEFLKLHVDYSTFYGSRESLAILPRKEGSVILRNLASGEVYIKYVYH